MTEARENRSARADRIVVGVDGTKFGLDAVRWAVAEAARRHWAVRCVHVRPDRSAWASPEKLDADEANRAADRLRVAIGVATETNAAVPLDSLVRTGTVTTELFDESSTARALVLGSRGLGRPAEALPDSSILLLAMHAPCPVVVVPGDPIPPPTHPKRSVVVGVDGSAVSEPALAYAFDAASLRGADLVAVHTWTDLLGTIQGQGAGWDAVQEEEELILAERLAGWQEKYPDLRVRRSVTMERPAESLLEESANAELLVVGSRGRGGFHGMLLGSTSQALLYCTTCPLAIIRPGEPI